MTEPRFSVIMPVYNRAAMVGRACRSVLDQTIADVELIVVDDGSTDGSADIVAGISDPRVRLIRLGENRGANAARNAGIREARGRVLSFLDSDDLFLPNKLEVAWKILAARPDVDAVLDSFRSIERLNGCDKDCRNPAVQDSRVIPKLLFTRRLWKATPSVSVRPEAARRAGLFDERLNRRQDFDFLVRLARVATIVSIPTITWLKAYTRDAITRDLVGFMDDFIAFWDRHPEFYDNPEFRRGFHADIARHSAKLLRRGRFGKLGRDLGRVRGRIGGRALVTSIVAGAGELRRLKRYRSA